MNTSLKVITAALTVAVLATGTASAETASVETLRHAHAHATSSDAHQTRSTQTTPATGHNSVPVVEDCVHVAFPQCSGGN